MTIMFHLVNIHIRFVRFEDDAEHDRHVPYPVLLTVSPWSHTFGCIVLINFIACHRPIIFLPKFVDHHYLAAIEVCHDLTI